MDLAEFDELLEKANLSKKEFSTHCETSYDTIMNWNRTKKVPKWTKSWLENYIDKKKFDKIKELTKDIK
jgi:DNA-binding transcriptional regulator YiaG